MAIDTQPDDGARLMARGAVLHLKDGLHRVLFTYEALELLEEEFGGLDDFVASLREKRLKAKRLRNIRMGLTAGLLHERRSDVPLEQFKQDVLEQLDGTRLVDYLDALTLAIMEAFPARTKEDDDPKGTGSNGSPGNGSITSPRSSTTGRTRSSGA